MMTVIIASRFYRVSIHIYFNLLAFPIPSSQVIFKLFDYLSVFKDERIGEEYSRHNNGLFPAPFPQDSPDMTRICQLFAFLGIFLAKCLQDNRLVDIPLSSPFFKMLCAGKGKYAKLSRTMSQNSDAIGQGQFSDDESVDDVFDVAESTEKMDSHYFSDVITDHDFEQIHPNKAKFIKQLTLYVEKRQKILCDTELDESKRRTMLDDLPFVTESGVECKLEDLGWVTKMFSSLLLAKS